MPPAELLGKDRFAEKERAADKKEQQEEDGDTKPDVLYADDPGCIHRAPRFAGNVRRERSEVCLLIACAKSLWGRSSVVRAGDAALRDLSYIDIE